MVYFTDMLLVPGDGGSGSEELKQALNGSGMIRCAQVKNEPDIVVDWTKTLDEGEYLEQAEARIKSLMTERYEEDFDTAGAWGGPGGPSEAWGVVKNEPEVTYRIVDGEVIVKVVNAPPPMDEDNTDLLYAMHDWLAGNVAPATEANDGVTWDVEEVEGHDDLFRVFWKDDPNWKPEPPEPDFDDYDY